MLLISTKHVLSVLHALLHFFFHLNLFILILGFIYKENARGRCYQHSHFIDEETERHITVITS